MALIAGGGHFVAMAMPLEQGGGHMADVQNQEMNCKGCARARAAAPCDAVCVALSAIDVASIDLPNLNSHERWTIRPESGATYSVRPDTSPPRV